MPGEPRGPRKIRVLHLIEDLGFGGAEKLLTQLLPALRARGVEADVASLGVREEMAPCLRDEGIPVHVAGLPDIRRPVRAVRWVRARLESGRHDILHTHLARANLYGRLVRRRGGTLVTCSYHDSDYEPEVLLDNPAQARWKQKMYQWADALSLRRCPRVVAVSQHVAGSIVRRLHVPADRVEVIHNGVPASLLREVPPETRRARRRALALPLDAPVIVQVGRLTPQKGHLYTLRAARRLRTERGPHWVFVGDGPFRQVLEAARRSDGLEDVVRLTGARSDVEAFLEAADLFVFPSLHEGLGIAALEAMAVGLPVVAFRTGPIPEVVADGETGLLVPPRDDAALADAVASLLKDKPRAIALGARGRQRVRERFLIDQTAEHHARFYAGLGVRQARPAPEDAR